MTKISKRYKALQRQGHPGQGLRASTKRSRSSRTAPRRSSSSPSTSRSASASTRRSPTRACAARPMLPHGTGKTVRVAVFCPPGEKAEAAKAAGADVVGMDDLAEKMQAGDLNFDARHRDAGCDARGRQARPAARSARPDAEPEGRLVSRPTSSPRSRTPRPARSSSATTRPASSTARSARRISKPTR